MPALRLAIRVVALACRTAVRVAMPAPLSAERYSAASYIRSNDSFATAYASPPFSSL